MRAMHLCYANSGSDFSTYVWRIESLTPQPVRDRQVKQEKKIAVFSEAEGSVTGRPLESLKANAVAYQDRGWCRAELEWSKPYSFDIVKGVLPKLGRSVRRRKACFGEERPFCLKIKVRMGALLNIHAEPPWTPAEFQGAVGSGQLKFTQDR